MHQNWKRIVLGLFVVGLLIVSFWYGGNAPGLQGFSVSSTESVVSDDRRQTSDAKSSKVKDTADIVMEADATEESDNIFQQIVMNVKLKKKATASSNKTQSSKQAQKNANKSVEKQEKKNKKSNKKSNKKKSSVKTESTTQNQKETTESNNQQESTTRVTTESSDIENTTEHEEKQTTEQEETRKDTVTISISCAILLDQMDLLKETKKKYVPKDGIILGETEVEIEEGDTVFDVLQEVTKRKKIHLEYSYTPAYKSHYIEGIYNIYEFDAGNLSGWMYCVNDEFTGVGCSSYEVEDGDTIRWLYSCELGKDIGNYFDE